jgi:hypothetical protein
LWPVLVLEFIALLIVLLLILLIWPAIVFVIYLLTLYVIVLSRNRRGDVVRDAPTSRFGRLNDWMVRKIIYRLPLSNREPPTSSSPSDSRIT